MLETERLASACRDAATLAREAEGWLAEHGGSTAEIEKRRMLRSEYRAQKLAASADKPMAAGVFGASQTGKSYLISALARRSGEPLRVHLGPDTPDFLKEINPEGGKESTGLVTRFTLQKVASRCPEGFPVSIRLLTPLDLVKILSNSFFLDFDANEEEPPSVDRVEKAIAEARAAAGPAEADPVRAIEFDDLRDYIRDRFRSRPTARRLETETGYWDALRSLGPRLKRDDRLKLLSFLWGGIRAYDRLYAELYDAVAALGFADQAYAARNALVPRERSIIDASVLQEIAGEGPGDRIEVTSAEGRRATLRRPVLTAIVAELTLEMTEEPYPYFRHTDLLDFPGARSRHNYKDYDATLAEPAKLAETLLRGKVAYLFERYSADFELNALVVCVVPGNQEVRSLPEYVTPWIELMHGDTPQRRSGSQIAMFLALTKFDLLFEEKRGMAEQSGQRWETAISTALIDLFDASGDWVRSWQPGSPFDNVFWIRNPGMVARGLMAYDDSRKDPVETGILSPERVEKMKAEYLATALIGDHVRDASRAWDEAFAINDGGLSYLAERLGEACRPELKARQLANALRTLMEDMLATLSKLHVSDDTAEERAKHEAAIRDCLRGVLALERHRSFGALLSATTVSPEEVEAALRLMLMDAAQGDDNLRPPRASDERDRRIADSLPDELRDLLASEEPPASGRAINGDRSRAFADAALDLWSRKLLDLAPDALPRIEEFGEAEREILTRELMGGASGEDLRGEMAEAVAPFVQRGQSSPEVIFQAALVTSRLINRYVTTLGQTEMAQEARARRRDGTPVFQAGKRRDEISSLSGTRSRNDFLSADWVIAFHKLAGRNLERSIGKDANTPSNRALGAILSRMRGITKER